MREEISFGSWLRQRRRKLDLTQQGLADQVGCARITLRRIEADALKPSKELALILLEKLGVPSVERTQWVLFARGLSGFPEKPAVSFPGKPLTNLPASLTSFIGREQEQAEIVRHISKYRLVTLTGSGGVGKTRLSLQVGNQVLGDYADGVWLVELASLNDPALLLQTVAAAFGIIQQTNTPLTETLTNVLRARTMLLILDNCEHLLVACAQLVDSLLKSCPDLKILATSRGPLGIMGELAYRVPSLGLPDIQQLLENLRECESIRLFEERAQLAQTNFSLTLENASSVSQICLRLDGIPLAIELAAARVGMYSTEQIAAQLNESLNLLTGGSRTALPRQQTIRASIDWSWNLLSDSERILLRRLSIFADGWTLEAARLVCSGNDIESRQVLDLMTQLVARSLVVVNQESGRETRYRFHEIVRQHAYEKLVEGDEEKNIGSEHLKYFLKLAEEAEPQLQGAQQILWVNRLEMEHDNLRAALERSLAEEELEAGLRLAGALRLFWVVHGYHREGRMWLDRMLIKSRGSASAPNAFAQAKVMYGAGYMMQRQGDIERAREQFEASLALYQQLEDEIQVATVLVSLGELAQDEGDMTSAKELYEQSLALFRQLGDMHGASIALIYLGYVAFVQGDYQQAITLSAETLALRREHSNRRVIATALNLLGFASWGQGNLEQADRQFREALSLVQKLADKWVGQYSLDGMAMVALNAEQPIRAARLFGAAESLRKVMGAPIQPSQRAQYDFLLASVRAQLDEGTFNAAFNEGRAMTLDEAVAYALQET